MATLREYVSRHMSPEKGWPYTSLERHLEIGPEGRFAWFDERLMKGDYTEVRGTGVLQRVGGVWLLAHYCLAYTIPNDLAGEVTGLVRSSKRR